MAAVLQALASPLSSMLTNMVKDEVSMLLGVSGEVEKLGDKLRDLNDFLADAERRRVNDMRVQRWVGKLKDVMYEATDVMELCQLKAMKRQESVPVGADVGFCLRNPRFTHDIGCKIRELNQRLDDIKKDAKAIDFIKLPSNEEPRPTRKTSPGIDPSAVVGDKIEEDTRSLVEVLVQEKRNDAHSRGSSFKIVAVVGTGGIGKTTLAQMIFNNETIEDKFDKRIWLSITKDFNLKKLRLPSYCRQPSPQLEVITTGIKNYHCCSEHLWLPWPGRRSFWSWMMSGATVCGMICLESR
ncbi:unnamed protein product [Urochloa humidicola]